MGIDASPKSLVLLIITPDFLVVFAYVILFWQLLSIYYDGHANLFKSVLTGKGKYLITFLGLILLITQVTLILLYLNSSIQAKSLVIELIVLNFLAPSVVLIITISMAFKFSGNPVRSPIYSQKLKLLQIAVLVWSIARILRATGGLFESKLFYGMILGLSNQGYNTFYIPMMLILIFLIIEIGPFLFVLDWHFMEIFIMKSFPSTITEPLFEHQGKTDLSYMS